MVAPPPLIWTEVLHARRDEVGGVTVSHVDEPRQLANLGIIIIFFLTM